MIQVWCKSGVLFLFLMACPVLGQISVEEAVLNLEPLLAVEPSPELEKRLREELTVWTQRRDSAKNQQTALDLQLENRLADGWGE